MSCAFYLVFQHIRATKLGSPLSVALWDTSFRTMRHRLCSSLKGFGDFFILSRQKHCQDLTLYVCSLFWGEVVGQECQLLTSLHNPIVRLVGIRLMHWGEQSQFLDQDFLIEFTTVHAACSFPLLQSLSGLPSGKAQSFEELSFKATATAETEPGPNSHEKLCDSMMSQGPKLSLTFPRALH